MPDAGTGVTMWVDGLLTSGEQAQVSALDHGLTVGDGVFESCKVVDGHAFALTRHLRRLRTSAEGLGLDPVDEGWVRQGVGEVLGEAPVAHGRLRITWTAGAGPLGSDRPRGTGTLLVAVAGTTRWGRDVSAVTVPWTRNERAATAGLKTTSYADNVVALATARARGAHEALMANTRGELCEGTGSNVVVALDGALVTPPLDSGCLAGITRELLLEWAGEEGLRIEERAVPFDVLGRAEEVLLCSSTRDVQPLSAVDGRALNGGGALGRAAVDLFRSRAAADVDP